MTVVDVKPSLVRFCCHLFVVWLAAWGCFPAMLPAQDTDTEACEEGIVPAGDVNGDDVVDLADAVELVEFLTAGGPAPVCEVAADMNGDGELSVADAREILKTLYGAGDEEALDLAEEFEVIFGPAMDEETLEDMEEADEADEDEESDETDETTEDDHRKIVRVVPAKVAEVAVGIGALIPPCSPSGLTLVRWPLDGVNGRDWMINNYVDLDPTSGRLDYLGFAGGLARTYDGHRGIDIDIPSFRGMDNNTALVRATAPGVVEDLREDQFDRNMSCTGTWNFVSIRHANGFLTIYGHLKKNSVVVNKGDFVNAGTVLGVAGSSGCSSWAHLHFEARDCDNNAIETFQLGMWSNPPAYNAPSRIMDVMLRKGSFSSAVQVIDPVPNPTLLKPYSTLGVGLSMGGHSGDTVDWYLRDPSNQVFHHQSWVVGGANRFRHLFPYWNKNLGGKVGTWTLSVYVNGGFNTSRKFKVSNYEPGSAEVAKHGVSASAYQTVFTDITSAGYRPVWVDGYDVNGKTYFNAIFRPAGGVAWSARHGMSGAQYQGEFNYRTGLGYRPLQVESYKSGGSIRYAAIFVKQAGPAWAAYHGRTAAQHQALFNNLRSQGYRPVNVAVVSVGGNRYYTAFYDKKNVGSWLLKSYLTPGEYQNHVNSQAQAGRRLHYLNAYTHNGSTRFSAIWNSEGYGAYAAKHGLTSAWYQHFWNLFTGNGYLTRLVTGYDGGSSARFGALWTH